MRGRNGFDETLAIKYEPVLMDFVEFYLYKLPFEPHGISMIQTREYV